MFWNNTFHVKSLMMKIFIKFKATQGKSLKIVVAKSLITNAHGMIIISHIRTVEIEMVPHQELRVLGGEKRSRTSNFLAVQKT